MSSEASRLPARPLGLARLIRLIRLNRLNRLIRRPLLAPPGRSVRRSAMGTLAARGRVGLLAAGLFALIGAGAPAAVAADAAAWPGARPVSIIVPFTAGGNVDTTARLVADRLGSRLGQSVIVDNVPGAGGVIGATRVARAAPDGYSLLMGFEGPIAIARSLNPAAVRFDPLKDLVAVAATTTAPMVIVTRPDFPADDIDGLIALARKSPGRIGYATSGIGTVLHLTMEIIEERAKIDVEHVPYKGGAQIASDVIGGHVDLAILVSTSVVPQIKAGKLKALAVTTAKRLDALPGVRVLAESPAFAGIDITTWTGLFVPAGTPAPIIERLNTEVNAVLAEPTVRTRLEAGGATPGSGSAAAFGDFVREDEARFARVIASAGISVKD